MNIHIDSVQQPIMSLHGQVKNSKNAKQFWDLKSVVADVAYDFFNASEGVTGHLHKYKQIYTYRKSYQHQIISICN